MNKINSLTGFSLLFRERTLNHQGRANVLSEYELKFEVVICNEAQAIRFGKANNGVRFVRSFGHSVRRSVRSFVRSLIHVCLFAISHIITIKVHYKGS